MEGLVVNDVLNWINDPEIKEIIKDEKIYYTGLKNKINHY